MGRLGEEFCLPISSTGYPQITFAPLVALDYPHYWLIKGLIQAGSSHGQSKVFDDVTIGRSTGEN
jgi:hypothetical protein